MSGQKVDITPALTVHALLEAYPQLEEVLISIAPPFAKLRNPILRRSVARVATIQHISSVGGVPLDELVNRLREVVGQPRVTVTYEDQDYFGEQPEWFSPEKISLSLDENEVNDRDRMTLVIILEKAKAVQKGQIIELVTSFLPAPGIDILKSKGYEVWTRREAEGVVRSSFLKTTD